MIQLKDYFGRWESHPEVTEEIKKNAQVLISKVSELLSLFGEDRKINSGFRPRDYNRSVGGSINSAHCFGLAIDLEDNNRELGKFCQSNIELLVELKLYMESLEVTHKQHSCWVHLTTRRPKSGSTIFLP